jgi:hypothetical protein
VRAPNRRPLQLPRTWLAAAVLLPLVAAAGSKLPSPAEFEDALPRGGSLTGREIYDRFLDNKFRRSFQKLRVISRDPGGSEQSTSFSLSLEDARDEQRRARDGVKARILIEVSEPFDLRHTQYLIIAKDPGPDDEFLYQPSARRARRVGIKQLPLMGTDYSFDDIAYHDIEDASYVRLPDEAIGDTPVYVIEASIKDTLNAEFHRTVSYLEQEHYVPLRIRYWDAYGVEIKELTADASTIRAFGDTWVATPYTMRNLRQRTTSVLHIDHFDSEPSFAANLFSVARMNRGK